MNKPTDSSEGEKSAHSPMIPSITTNPVATAVAIQPNTQKSVLVTSSIYRDSSMSPTSSSTVSSSSPPPLAPMIDGGGFQGTTSINNCKKQSSQVQQLNDSVVKVVKVPSSSALNNRMSAHNAHLIQTNSQRNVSYENHPKNSSNVLSSSSSSSFSTKASSSSCTNNATGNVCAKNSRNTEALNV